jgi:hypothetical protein
VKAAWTALAVVAVIGFLCCGGIFFVGWRAWQLSQRAGRGATEWANAHFAEIAGPWNAAAWVRDRQPDGPVSESEIQKEANQYDSKYGSLRTVEPFFPTSVTLANSAKGLEFNVALAAQAKFVKRPATVVLRLHHAMGAWTVRQIELRPPSN